MDFGLPLGVGEAVGAGEGDFVRANGLPRFCGEVEDILKERLSSRASAGSKCLSAK
jgi:hypothetical protein